MSVIITRISRIAIGLLFIFSGFVKCVDPAGSAIKFEEYFAAFNMDWLSEAAIYLAVTLSATEMALGVVLLFGFYKRLSSWIALSFMTFFTILTIVIYFTNPVQDCGCFGDAIKLSNGATLLKNVIALIVLLPFFINAQKHEWFNDGTETFIKFISIVVVVSFIPIYAINYLPFVDFLPYKVGVNITQAMSIPEGAEHDEYKTTLLYKSIPNGEIKEFAVEDTTWYDQTKWEYIDTKTTLIKRGYTPEITSFNIFDREKNDVTSMILSEGKHIALFVINKKEIPPKIMTNITKAITFLRSRNITPVFVTRFEIEWLSNILYSIENCASFDLYNADETLLKSIIRSPFGVIVIKNGTIESKHNLNHIITPEQLSR